MGCSSLAHPLLKSCGLIALKHINKTTGLLEFLLVIVDAINQCLHTFEVHCVVATCAETTHQTVSLDTYHATLGSELEEIVLQFLVLRFRYEADIHARTVFLVENRRHEHLAVVEAIVEQVSLLLVAFVDPCYAAVSLKPALQAGRRDPGPAAL